MSTAESEARLVAANADLIDATLRKAGVQRHWLADEYRSAANLALFEAARRFASSGDAEECRRYAARSIFSRFVNVRIHFRRRGRTWAPLGEALDAGYHPESREVPPDAMLLVRERVEREGVPDVVSFRSKHRAALNEAERKQVQDLISADPSRSNKAIAKEFSERSGVLVHTSSVRNIRNRMGLPPSKARRGKAWRASR